MSNRNAFIIAVLSIGVLSLPSPVFGDQKSKVTLSEHQVPMARLVGLWNCKEHHFDEVGQEIAQIDAFEQIDWLLDQNVIRRSYSRSVGRKSYRAVGMLAWNQAAGRFEGSWYDNVSTTGPSVVVGRWDEAKKQFIFEMTIATGQGKTSTYTIIESFDGHDKREVTTYEHRGQELIKRTHVNYQRTAPCPEFDEMRVIGLDEEFALPKKNKD